MSEGNKQCCVACRHSAPAGGKGRQGSPIPASVARFGEPLAFPGSTGLAHPRGTRTPASHFDPERKCAGQLKAMQAGYILPPRSVSERGA